MTSIKISIITVIFNAEKIIKKTIDSITSQKYKNVEIIIIDGASTDRTLENTGLVETNNIKILSESDNGIYDAMNKGLKLASGDFVIFMNAGDSFVSDSTISDMVEKMLDLNSIYYGNALYIEENINNSRRRGGEFNKYRLASTNICHQTIFYPQIYYINHFFNLKYNLFADWEYNMRAFHEKINFIYLDINVAFYDSTGVSATLRDSNFEQEVKKLIYYNLGFFPLLYIGYRKILRIFKIIV